jgi:hypothetical protein
MVAGACIGPTFALTAFHPLHTTMTTLSWDASSRTATAEMRIFLDDLAKAVAHPGNIQPTDSAAVAYVRDHFAITGPDGRVAPLAICGLHQSADVKWICLRASLPGGLSGARIQNAVLAELYADQVNVVMTDGAATHTSFLFTRGDAPKAVP